MHRRKLLVALGGLAVLVAVGAFVVWPRADRITRENYDRIREGMTRAEVEAILGGPPGDYRTVRTEHAGEGPAAWGGDLDWYAVLCARHAGASGYSPLDSVEHPDLPNDARLLGTWFGNEGYVLIVFVSDAVDVDGKDFYRTVNLVKSPFDNLLWRARRLWRKWFPQREAI
jgi:hypothetical protein